MRTSHQRVLRCFLWITIATGRALHAQQLQPVAGILDVTGNWQLNGQQSPARAGQKLYDGDKISTAEYNYANSITIVHYNDGSRTRFACENSPKNPCRGAYIVNARSFAASAQETSLIRAALDLLLGTPPAVLSNDFVTMSRGKYAVAVREDIVNFDRGKGLSLNGRLPILPAGTYAVKAMSTDEGQKAIASQINVDAAGAWQSLIPVPAPGLYTINVKDANGDLRANLLMLFVDALQYDSSREAFDVVKNQADTWQGVNAQSDEDILLRAILLAMSKST